MHNKSLTPQISIVTNFTWSVWSEIWTHIRMHEFLHDILANFEPLMGEHCISEIGESVAIPKFPASTLSQLCDYACATYQTCPNIVQMTSPCIVAGDIHGNLQDLIRVFTSMGRPPCVKYLFLGDYVDRGGFSIEVITLLLTMHCLYPNEVVLIRGNHEFSSVNCAYGFRDEIVREYEKDDLWERFNEVFARMPLAAIVNKEILCVHGGLGPNLTSVGQIEQAPRPLTKHNMTQAIWQLLWSDPSDEVYLYQTCSSRGSPLWGYGATEHFFAANGLKLLIRGHECVTEGTRLNHNGKVITVFTSSNYDHTKANDAAVLVLEDTNQITRQTWAPMKWKIREASMFYSVTEKKSKRIFQLHETSPQKLAAQKLFSLRGSSYSSNTSFNTTPPLRRKWVTMSHSFIEL